MNHQTRVVLDTDILGDSCLQERFTVYIEILGHIVQRESRSISLERATELSAIPATALRRHLQELSSFGILKKRRGIQDTWNLVKDPWDVTLEDVFRCAVTACSSRRRGSMKPPAASAGDLEIDMLLMQAVQAVDDQLHKSLRTYSLDRLGASGSAPFPLPRRHAVRMFADID
jgi:DNA-binding IscR family transcriptional regulator